MVLKLVLMDKEKSVHSKPAEAAESSKAGSTGAPSI